MYTYTQYRRRFVFCGNEILRYSAKYPSFDKNGEITEFYKKLSNECELFCEQNKFNELCESLKANVKSLKKATCQQYTYSFCSEISEISEDVVSILLTVCFYRSKNDIILSFSEEQRWSLTTNMIMRTSKN